MYTEKESNFLAHLMKKDCLEHLTLTGHKNQNRQDRMGNLYHKLMKMEGRTWSSRGSERGKKNFV